MNVVLLYKEKYQLYSGTVVTFLEIKLDKAQSQNITESL